MALKTPRPGMGHLLPAPESMWPIPQPPRGGQRLFRASLGLGLGGRWSGVVRAAPARSDSLGFNCSLKWRAAGGTASEMSRYSHA